ncbi:HNH endonuclease [uncultured Dialister sp.]|uniref:HNH endonuclease n=1 Tax=uncultured Dialister sp. TaxID=278064 RepID=UPI00265ED65F|nr:HNH endonuclease [uncultured Dialister sp.]
MPWKPKKPCAYPGCKELTKGRYCEQHQKLMDKYYDTHERSPVSKKRYGRAWKRIRDRYIGKHPLCEMCLKNNKITPATEVHHIRPLSRGGTHDEDNLMALCKPCHSQITAEMDDRWHHARKEYHYE